MMRFMLLTILVLPLLAGPARAAAVEVNLLRTIPLGETPLQTVTTVDGQRIYVLTNQGNVQIYSADGQLQGVFAAGPGVTGIAPQGSNQLLLQQTGRKELTLVAVDPVIQIATEGSPSMGNPTAPVTIVVFNDFECPYCAKAVPLLKEVLASYPEQVRLVYKNFPLSMHKNARAAAIAGAAAEKQGKFWPLHDLLFANYNQLSPEKIQQLAKQAGLDMPRFEADRNNPQLAQLVNRDTRQGQQLGVRGTPTIFINGRKLSQRNKAAFDQLIQAELAKMKTAQ